MRQGGRWGARRHSQLLPNRGDFSPGVFKGPAEKVSPGQQAVPGTFLATLVTEQVSRLSWPGLSVPCPFVWSFYSI